MKKSLSLLLLLPLLAGCDAGKGINCSEIVVYSGEEDLFSGEYECSYSKVYEYMNSSGDCIYVDRLLKDSSHYNNEPSSYLDIKVYSTRLAKDYTVYEYSDFIGYLKVENFFYYKKNKNQIISETKYSRYEYGTPDGEEKIGNNAKAYSCAKLGYYTSVSQTIIKEETETSLSRKTYLSLGEDTIVLYKEKK